MPCNGCVAGFSDLLIFFSEISLSVKKKVIGSCHLEVEEITEYLQDCRQETAFHREPKSLEKLEVEHFGSSIDFT